MLVIGTETYPMVNIQQKKPYDEKVCILILLVDDLIVTNKCMSPRCLNIAAV